ncbi:MAG: caspase family protein [Kofleriaceae bacterium]
MPIRGHAIHIGLNHLCPEAYPEPVPPLGTAEDDAAALAEVTAGAGLAVSVLRGDAATRANVLESMEHVADLAVAGELVVVSFSGHGTRYAGSRIHGNPPEDYDESWCLYDGFLIADEIYACLAAFRAGVRVFLLIDSGHDVPRPMVVDLDAPRTRTGPIALPRLDERGIPLGVRALPVTTAYAAYRRRRRTYNRARRNSQAAVRGEVKACVLALAACSDDQVAIESEFHGCFTAAVLEAWDRGGFDGSHQDFAETVAELCPPAQTPVLIHVGAHDDAFIASTPFTLEPPTPSQVAWCQ